MAKEVLLDEPPVTHQAESAVQDRGTPCLSLPTTTPLVLSSCGMTAAAFSASCTLAIFFAPTD